MAAPAHSSEHAGEQVEQVEQEGAPLTLATMATMAQPLMPPDGWQPIWALAEVERERILQAAQRGGDLEALRHVLWSLAVEPERGATFIDLPTQIRRNMLEASAPRNELVRKTTETQCEILRADLLAGCSAMPLERLLVDRIVTCWLAAYLADGDAAGSDRMGYHSGSDYTARRQDRAHRRLLQSIESLARVQRLMRPGPLVAMAQVNIAQPGAQQVNIAAAAGVVGAPDAPSATVVDEHARIE